MVHNLLNKDEKRVLNQTFKLMDTNKDGVISKDEIKAGKNY